MEDPRTAVLHLTAQKFFPGYTITTGLLPDPWVRVEHGTVMAEVHIPRNTAVDQFEIEVYQQLKRLQADITVEGSPIA